MSARVIPGELVVYPGPVAALEHQQAACQVQGDSVRGGRCSRLARHLVRSCGVPHREARRGEKSLERGNWRMLEKPALIILGREAAGRGPAEVGRLAIDHRANVLVIEADWLGANQRPPPPKSWWHRSVPGALADLRTQRGPCRQLSADRRLLAGALEPPDMARWQSIP